MNTTSTSTGERITTQECDRRIRKAKQERIDIEMLEHGYVFCHDCKRSGGVRIDCSHDISVKEAKESGRTELCWDVENITMLCRQCHKKKDGLYLGLG